MYCRKCGKKLEENERFCSVCGEPVAKTDVDQLDSEQQDNNKMRNDSLQRQVDNSKRYVKNNMADQPTKALIVEGIGILFFIYMLIVNGSSDYNTQKWLEKNGVGVFIIGLIFLVISYFMLKKYKKNHKLYGIGYAGYIISCIAVVLMVAMVIMSILLFIQEMIFTFVYL